jgi:hypothetical protein
VYLAASLAVMGAAVVAGFGSLPAGAAPLTVTNNSDSGPGSLRQALADSVTSPGPDGITVQAGIGTITLTTGPISWSGDNLVTIQGNGVTINANGRPAR